MSPVLLAIDTATSAVTAAVHDGVRVLAAESVPQARRHAETLTPTIDVVMSRAGMTPGDLDAVAVGVGPGPFTGLRVGIVTATTLGLALEIPVHGVCSLDAIAHRVAAESGPEEYGDFIVATDARRREVYWARYRARDGVVARLGDPAVSPPGALDPALRALPAAGRGPLLYPADFGVVLPVGDMDAGSLAGLVAYRLQHGGELLAPTPLYLRQPDATPSAAQKSVLR